MRRFLFTALWLCLLSMITRADPARVAFLDVWDRSMPQLHDACQEAGLPPWRRSGPLLFDGGQLLAVAGLGMDARAFAPAGEQVLALRWMDDEALIQSEG